MYFHSLYITFIQIQYYLLTIAHFFVHGMTSATYIIEIWKYWCHSKHQNWHWRCRSSRIWIYVWLSSGDQYLLLAVPVLAFLAFILKICLISKIVRLQTLQFTHKNRDLKIVTKNVSKTNPIQTWPWNLGLFWRYIWMHFLEEWYFQWQFWFLKWSQHGQISII